MVWQSDEYPMVQESEASITTAKNEVYYVIFLQLRDCVERETLAIVKWRMNDDKAE